MRALAITIAIAAAVSIASDTRAQSNATEAEIMERALVCAAYAEVAIPALQSSVAPGALNDASDYLISAAVALTKYQWGNGNEVFALLRRARQVRQMMAERGKTAAGAVALRLMHNEECQGALKAAEDSIAIYDRNKKRAGQ